MFNSSWVGLRVMEVIRPSVRWSTSPVTGSCRLPWKPLTDSTVVSSYSPLTSGPYQPICFSRAWRSLTLSPLAPLAIRAGPGFRTLFFSSSVGFRVIEVRLSIVA